MRKVLVLLPPLLYFAYLLFYPANALAQGPVEQCLIPFDQVDYTPFSGYSANVHPSTGWNCGPIDGPFQDCYGTDDQFGLRMYVANTYVTKSGLFGNSHPPLRIDIFTEGAFFDVYVGEAQLGQFTAGPYQTYSITVSQGIVITDQIRIFGGRWFY